MSLPETSQTPSKPTRPARRRSRRVEIGTPAADAPDGRGARAVAADHPYATAGGLDPAHMTAAERLDEVARILAVGIIRLKARQNRKNPNNPNHLREFGLDFSVGQSVCGLETTASGESR